MLLTYFFVQEAVIFGIFFCDFWVMRIALSYAYAFGDDLVFSQLVGYSLVFTPLVFSLALFTYGWYTSQEKEFSINAIWIVAIVVMVMVTMTIPFIPVATGNSSIVRMFDVVQNANDNVTLQLLDYTSNQAPVYSYSSNTFIDMDVFDYSHILGARVLWTLAILFIVPMVAGAVTFHRRWYQTGILFCLWSLTIWTTRTLAITSSAFSWYYYEEHVFINNYPYDLWITSVVVFLIGWLMKQRNVSNDDGYDAMEHTEKDDRYVQL